MSKPKPAPRLPNVASARKLVHDVWVDPTEAGLDHVRRLLVRRMWQARKIQHWQPNADQHPLTATEQQRTTKCRADLRGLYHLVLQRQQARDWEITDAERRSRHRNRNNPHQYAREALQRQKGSAALLALNIPASPADHAYQPTAATTSIIIHQGAQQTETPKLLTAKYRNQRLKSLHRFAVHHLARVLYLAHYQGWLNLNLTPSYGAPPEEPRPASKGAVQFSGTLCIEGVVIRVDTLITTNEYRQALNRLTPAHQDEIVSYYRRNPAKNDVAPEVESWTYSKTVHAFDALLHALYDQGSLRRD